MTKTKKIMSITSSMGTYETNDDKTIICLTLEMEMETGERSEILINNLNKYGGALIKWGECGGGIPIEKWFIKSNKPKLEDK